MANIALALAFALSLLSLGSRMLSALLGKPLMQTIPAYQGHILVAYASYCVPAALIYLGLRTKAVTSWLRPTNGIHYALGIGNFILVAYVVLRVLASTVQGGGASFAVLSFAPIIIIPAMVILFTGLTWLIARSIKQKPDQAAPEYLPMTGREDVMLASVIGIPAAVFAIMLYVIPGAPLRVAGEANEFLKERCATAGEHYLDTSIKDVQSVYLDPDRTLVLTVDHDGFYGGVTSMGLGSSLISGGWLLYVERALSKYEQGTAPGQFKRQSRLSRKEELISEISSDFGVYQKDLVERDLTNRLGVSGTEVTVKNIKTGKVVAVQTFYQDARQRKVCGNPKGVNLDTTEFVKKALNLKPTFKSSADAPK